jgi:hypothetical protein
VKIRPKSVREGGKIFHAEKNRLPLAILPVGLSLSPRLRHTRHFDLAAPKISCRSRIKIG